MRVANFILNYLPMGSAKKLGVTYKYMIVSPIGLLIMTRLLIFIWQKCHGVGNFDLFKPTWSYTWQWRVISTLYLCVEWVRDSVGQPLRLLMGSMDLTGTIWRSWVLPYLPAVSTLHARLSWMTKPHPSDRFQCGKLCLALPGLHFCWKIFVL